MPEPTTIEMNIRGFEEGRIVSVSNRTMKDELWSRLGGFGAGLILGLVGVAVSLVGMLARR